MFPTVVTVMFPTVATEREVNNDILLERTVCGIWEREADEDVELDSKNELD